MTMKRTGQALGALLISLALAFLPACSGSNSSGSSSGETIGASSGGSQQATINAPYSSPVVAKVVSGGSGVSGVSVTFTAPSSSSGASATFTGGKATTTVTTDANGNASATLTANGNIGQFSVTATAPNVTGTASFGLMNVSLGTITATNGIQQTTPVDTPFPLSLIANVTENGSATKGVSITFTAPSSGASGTFTGGTNVVTATTDSNGNATVTFTANATAGSYTVTATAPGFAGDAVFTMTNTAVSTPTIYATGGTPQTTFTNTAFPTKLQATVVGTSSVSGVQVTFTAPASNASGTFQNGTATETDTTDASGVATSSTFTANGTFGSYAITATATGVTNTATYNLTNNVNLTGATLYSFYLSGLEFINSGPNFYALAGSVAIDSDGTVVAGEQDYNDGFGNTSPQPTGDAITGGTLTVSSTTGQGTLTLNTNNANLGVAGVETLGVQFVNTKHALVLQFDGTATSSGSIDFQTLPSTLSGGYAFTLNGVDPVNYAAWVFGGVFTISGANFAQSGGTVQGVYDVDDFGASSTPTLGTTFSSATISAPDQFGRGSIVGTGIANTINYYTVGTEAVRIIDVDDVPNVIGDAAVGSAFGQGSTTFTNSSLGASVFGVQSNWFGDDFAAAGMFTTSSGTLSGTADDNELLNGIQLQAASIGGSYNISESVDSTTYNGYGSLTLTAGDLGDVSVLGIYMTDPTLNLSDPNNTTSGLGGALIADLDGFVLNGTGVVIPQTDTSTTSFNGTYTFGAQEFNTNISGGEFDFAGQGTVSSLALSSTGLVSDPWSYLSPSLSLTNLSISSGVATFNFTAQSTLVPVAGSQYTIANTGTAFDGLTVVILSSPAPTTTAFSVTTTFANASEPVSGTATPVADAGVGFSGTATADGSHAGRYTLPLTLDVQNETLSPYGVTFYQAGGGELFWLETDSESLFLGTLQQQGSLTGIPAVKKKTGNIGPKTQP
jgi:hypothetical protein